MNKITLFCFILFVILSCKSDKKTEINKEKRNTIELSVVTYENLVNEAEKYLKKGNIDEAYKTFLEAYKMDKKKPEALYGLGIYYNISCMRKKVSCDSAIFFLEKAEKINHSYKKVNYNLSLCYNMSNKTDKALEAINNAILLDSLDFDCYLQKALILNKKGDTKDACQNIKKAITMGAPKTVESNYPFCN